MTPLLASLLAPFARLAIRGVETVFSKLTKSGEKKKAAVQDALASVAQRLREQGALSDEDLAEATPQSYAGFIEAIFQEMKQRGELAEGGGESKSGPTASAGVGASALRLSDGTVIVVVK